MTDIEQVTTTRDRVIAAALDLYAVRGYDGTTIEDIADYAGVSAAAIARRFAGKEDILRAILTPDLERIGRILDRYDSVSVADVGALIEELIDAITDAGPQVAALLEDPAVGNRVYDIAHDSALTERIEFALSRQLGRRASDPAVPKTVSRTVQRMRAACAAAAIPTAIAAWRETNPAAPVIDREARQAIVDIVTAIAAPSVPSR